MKTTDVPKYKNVLWYLTKQIQLDDSKADVVYDPNLAKTTSATKKFVGFCKLTKPNCDEADAKIYRVILDDDYYKNNHLLDWNKCPLASIIRYVDDQERIFLINSVTRELFLNDLMRGFVVGILAHEVGHDLAGHLGKEKEEAGYARDELGLAAAVLLSGGSVVPKIEHEATQYAIGLVGVSTMVAMLALQSSLSQNIGVRMEFSNQMHRVIEQAMNPNYVPPTTEYQEMSIVILTDQQLDDFAREKDSETQTS